MSALATPAKAKKATDATDNAKHYCMCITPDKLPEGAQKKHRRPQGRPPQRVPLAARQHHQDHVSSSGSTALRRSASAPAAEGMDRPGHGQPAVQLVVVAPADVRIAFQPGEGLVVVYRHVCATNIPKTSRR